MFCWLGLICAWSLLRLVLVLAFGLKGQAITELLLGFLAGLQRDVFVASLMAVPPLLYLWVLPESIWRRRWHRYLFWSVGAVCVFLLLFLMVTEYFFFEEFKSRFNTVAVDYLIYPHEVFVNIWESYHTGIVIAVLAIITGCWVWFCSRRFAPMWDHAVSRRTRGVALGIAVVLVVVLLPTVSLQPPHVSKNRTVNELANDGFLSFFSAFWTHQLDYAAFYRTIGKAEAYEIARKLLSEPNTKFLEDGLSIRRAVSGDPARPKLNVVIILEESLGSPFWGCLGRTNSLTPHMDHLATTEGILFTNIYASGNRTVRGMEGVLSSFPPLPGDSIVKRHLSDNVETLARVFRRDGYTNLFLYGGRGLFDSMRSYAVRNGYHRFIEQSDFEHPTFSTVWGVCDEDLFNRGIEELHRLSEANQPFFATMLTVSNHKPYTFPEGKIPDRQGRRGSAVKYADYALGKFFEKARSEPFWTNTVFVVVADHGARVYGKQTIPIHSYEIPVVVLGPAVVKEPARVGTLGCSLDVGPTVLGLVGRPYESLFFGRDLLRLGPGEGRVLLNHNRDIGMLTHERLVVLGLMQNLEFYSGEPKQVQMSLLADAPSPSDLEFSRECMALYEVADDLYMHQRYALDWSVAPKGSVQAAK
jgi:phosphoglycerol transferase MdoB-like AlkP superfamily enzyme